MDKVVEGLLSTGPNQSSFKFVADSLWPESALKASITSSSTSILTSSSSSPSVSLLRSIVSLVISRTELFLVLLRTELGTGKYLESPHILQGGQIY